MRIIIKGVVKALPVRAMKLFLVEPVHEDLVRVNHTAPDIRDDWFANLTDATNYIVETDAASLVQMVVFDVHCTLWL